MATTKAKPASSRKKTTSARKTTRKTAPKAKVGITLTEEAQKAITPDNHPLPELTPGQVQAKLEAYHTLQGAGLEVPEQLQKEVANLVQQTRARQEQEDRIREENESKRAAKANIEGPWYVRNCYPAPFNFRLDRQTERRRIELKPRGNPGDMHPLKNEDLQDPVLVTNVKIGLIEIISAGEAQLIMEKQTTNIGQRTHTPLAMLRNELGEEYKPENIKLEAEFNSQGVTVAQVDPRVLQGQLHDRQVGGIGAAGGVQRVQQNQAPQGAPIGEPQFSHPGQRPVVRSGFVPTVGNPAIISQGGLMTDNARAKAVDDLARRKNTHGPVAGVGEVTVTVEPTQKT